MKLFSIPFVLILSAAIITGTVSAATKPAAKSASSKTDAQAHESSLTDVNWVLAPTSPSSKTTVSLQLNSNDHSITGYTVCNSLFGNYRSEGPNKVYFGNLGTTHNACRSSSDEKAYLRAIGVTRGYRIKGTELELLDQAGEVVAKFQASGMKMTASPSQLSITIPASDSVGAIPLGH